MSKTCRAKFRCVSKEGGVENPEGEVVLEAVVGGSPENDQFFNYTPYGQLRMGTVNAAAFAVFEVGKEYFLDFTPAE